MRCQNEGPAACPEKLGERSPYKQKQGPLLLCIWALVYTPSMALNSPCSSPLYNPIQGVRTIVHVRQKPLPKEHRSN